MKKSQVSIIAQCFIVLCALLIAGSSTQVDAQQQPGAHPGYLHAIRDLRQARELLRYNFTQPKQAAAANAALPAIDAAISDLKSASRVDDKHLEDVPHNKDLPAEGRFHQVMTLLNSAHAHVLEPDSDQAAISFRDHALGQIDNARKAITPVL